MVTPTMRSMTMRKQRMRTVLLLLLLTTCILHAQSVLGEDQSSENECEEASINLTTDEADEVTSTPRSDEETSQEEEEEEEDYDDDDDDDDDEKIKEFILDMGVPQTFDIMDDEVDYEEMLEDYLGGAAHLAAVAKNPELRHVLPYCKNKHALCTYWATRGDCDTNKYQMDMECCPVCESASQLDWNMECPFSKDQEHAWRPGDLNQFFVNLTTLPEYQRYQPTIHSQPSDNGGPWVVTLENVINEKEAAVLIQHGVEHGWEESFTESDPTADGTTESEVSDYRTSTLAWCMEKSCLNDTIVAGVLDRLSNITNLPQYHSDWLQLLRYRKGNYYKEHHDLLHHQIYSMGGHRILTFYIYLSDVEEGGGTNFPYVNNLTITPKLGRALLWPNVLNEDPDAMDDRMYHQALPVVKGEKYGATAWWHQRDYKAAYDVGCS